MISSTQKRELWEQLRTECKEIKNRTFRNELLLFIGFARLFTLAYSSSFVLALTELVVSALSGRLYSQSQIQQSLPASLTAPGGVSATSKSAHAEVEISLVFISYIHEFLFSQHKIKILYCREKFNWLVSMLFVIQPKQV